MSFKPGDFGVSIFYGREPMKKPCADCPFVAAAAGRDYLRPGRLDGIKLAVTMGQPFHCHKTVHNPNVEWAEDADEPPSWDPNYRVCAGATAFAEALAQELKIEPTRIGGAAAGRGRSRARRSR